MKRTWTDTRYGVVLCLVTTLASVGAEEPTREEALAGMRRAAAFMMDEVSTRGGFVAMYTEDLSERWGEVPARGTMIWVQDPGTVSVARLHLEAYEATGDEVFLRYAERSANALVWGQQPEGGWHYFIDFDKAGVLKWYEEVGSKCWGWEEFYHYYDNATYDDNVTTGAADFLLDLYRTTLDPRYRGPLLDAIGFMLESQLPEGGWPQRYPSRNDLLTGEGPGYTSYYTFNDGVTVNTIHFLLKAHRLLGNAEYEKAAVRGMRFVVASQLGAPQAGWGQQHDAALRPAGARNFEPKALCPSTTASNVRHLLRFYALTGDRRYLRGIPDALAWLDEARLPAGHSDEGLTHAQFVELGTNRPLYAHREGTSRAQGRYWVDYEPRDFPGHYGMQFRLDVDQLRAEYERVAALSPEDAMAEYVAQRDANTGRAGDAVKAQEALDGLDERGAWIEDLSRPDYTDWKYKPRRTFRGIGTRTYVTRMRTLVDYVGADGN